MLDKRVNMYVKKRYLLLVLNLTKETITANKEIKATKKITKICLVSSIMLTLKGPFIPESCIEIKI